MINVSHVSLGRRFGFDNNTDVRVELLRILYFQIKFINKIYAALFYLSQVYPLWINNARLSSEIRTSRSSFIAAQKTNFFIEDFFNKCDQIRSKLPIWSHLPKKSLMENFIFCTVYQSDYNVLFRGDKIWHWLNKIWINSNVTLSYIRNLSKRISIYIMNCLHEIKLNSNVNNWCFIPRKNNLADWCTCCNPLTSLTLSSLWVKEPQFLYKNESVCF